MTIQGRSHRSGWSGFHWTTFRGTKSRVRGESTVNGCENEFQGVAPESSRYTPSSKGRCIPQTNISEIETRAVLCVESVVQYLAIPALCVANVLGETPFRDRSMR